MNEIYEELNQIYGSSDLKHVPITHDDIKDMKLLERVIKGTLLLYSVVAIIARKVTQDVEGTRNWSVQKVAIDPDGFLPGRHSSSNFFPFSYGCRNCIGQKFAILEMTIIIAILIRKFIIKIDKPIEIAEIGVELNLSLKPTEAINLKF
ncbi:hypothetical protein HZH66_013675 [Vespula vulgaris]|uniref:Cytochrome P450 n=1 Tax=Vespula vulgaris TaxID=7454 RepID=A0A834J5E6_VESVU|nr:hypothetical protein HZH66_013675 [Vespula vulgaris]